MYTHNRFTTFVDNPEKLIVNKYVATKSLEDIDEEGFYVGDLDYIGVDDTVSTQGRNVYGQTDLNLTAIENALNIAFGFNPISGSESQLNYSITSHTNSNNMVITYTYKEDLSDGTKIGDYVYSIVIEDGRIKYLRQEDYVELEWNLYF